MNLRLPGPLATIVIAASLTITHLMADGIPIGIEIPANHANAADFARFTKNTDITPRVVAVDAQWAAGRDTIPFPSDTLTAIRRIDALPFVIWILSTADVFDGIAQGDRDAQVRELAKAAASDANPIRMSIATEGGNPVAAESYRRAFRHVVEIFRQEGAQNVRWIFLSDTTATEGPRAPLGMDAFPGNDVVDGIGMRGFNWGKTRTQALHGHDSEWKTFAEIFAPARKHWQATAPDKPMLVITAAAATGGEKADWVLDAVRTAAGWNLAALIWFQQTEPINWQIQESIPREIMMEAQTMNEALAP